MTGVTETLVPGKFVCIIGHILLVIIMYYLRDSNIYAGISYTASSDSDEYEKAEISLLISLAFATICLAFEVLIVLIGLTLYNDLLSVSSIFFHTLGMLFSIWFILMNWSYEVHWYI